MTEFDEYYYQTYPAAIEAINRALTTRTDLPILEMLTLKFAFVMERQHFPFPDDSAGAFLRDICTRLSQELFAFCWCLKGGSLSGAYQHFRGFIEMRAIVHYVKENPERRLRKWSQFRQLSKYQKHAKLSGRLARREITQEEFDDHNIIMPIDVESFTPDQLRVWKELWEVNTDEDLMKKVKVWHSKATIQNLLDAVDPVEPGEASTYDIACHVTHISPMTIGLIGRGLIMQMHEIPRVQDLIQMTYIEVYRITALIDEWVGTKELFNQLAPVMAQFRNSLIRPTPSP